MSRMINQLLLVAVVFALCTTGSFGQCSDADKKALEAFDKAWNNANTVGNREALEAILAEDLVSFGAFTTSNKKQGIDSVVRAAQRRKMRGTQDRFKIETDHYMISCTARTATITHRRVNKTMVNGVEGERYSRSIHFLERNGGRWQVVANANHPLFDRAHLMYKEISGYKAFINRDTKWFERNLHPDYIGVNPEGKAYNRFQSIQAIKNDTNKYESIRISNESNRIDGETGISTGIYHIKGKTSDGKPIDMKLRFTRTLVKKNGIWLALSSQVTAIPEN